MCCNLFWFETSLSARLREGAEGWAARKRLAFNGNFRLILSWYLLSLVLLMMGLDKSETMKGVMAVWMHSFVCRNIHLLIIIRRILECLYVMLRVPGSFMCLDGCLFQGSSICHAPVKKDEVDKCHSDYFLWHFFNGCKTIESWGSVPLMTDSISFMIPVVLHAILMFYGTREKVGGSVLQQQHMNIDIE